MTVFPSADFLPMISIFRNILTAFLALCLPAWSGEISAASHEEQVKLAHDVRAIFEAKCVDCHGPELARPKGKFGHVLDLKRMADNPDYVVRGNAEKSELFIMVRDDEMPGSDANVPPLTADEKATVKRWIEVGAPHGLPPGSEKTSLVAAADATPAASTVVMPTWKRALRWVGRFHPVSTHFPVALMLVAVFAEGLAWWTRRDSWMQTVRFLVVLGALGAVAAASLGWVNAAFSAYGTGKNAPILGFHRWLGTFTAVWCVVCAVLVIISECREGSPERQRFRGALLIGGVLISISGFLGSALIYGLDHYRW